MEQKILKKMRERGDDIRYNFLSILDETNFKYFNEKFYYRLVSNDNSVCPWVIEHIIHEDIFEYLTPELFLYIIKNTPIGSMSISDYEDIMSHDKYHTDDIIYALIEFNGFFLKYLPKHLQTEKFLKDLKISINKIPRHLLFRYSIFFTGRKHLPKYFVHFINCPFSFKLKDYVKCIVYPRESYEGEGVMICNNSFAVVNDPNMYVNMYVTYGFEVIKDNLLFMKN